MVPVGTEDRTMKKIAEFCPSCNKDTTHRDKKKSYKAKKRGESYNTVRLPLKCMVCGYLHGGPIKRSKKGKKHISFNK